MRTEAIKHDTPKTFDCSDTELALTIEVKKLVLTYYIVY